MELVEGETLKKRLEKGRLPLDQALEYAIQIANALDNAHRQGVVHRDLKPGNIMITKSAGVKLLDFGLARLGVRPPVTPLSQLPTEHDSEPLTAEGTILGTLRYMAPEQLEGKEADSRSDIFAFGVVVYEMVTGKKAFEGTSQAGLIAAIMQNNPRPMAELRADSPRMLDRIVGTCLAKSADDRWQSATDLERQIGWITESAAESAPPTPTVLARWRILPWVLAAAGLSLAGVTLIDREPPIALRPSVRLTIDLPPEAPLAPAGSFFLGVGRPSLTMSPDGSLLAYVAIVDGERQLYIRNMRTRSAPETSPRSPAPETRRVRSFRPTASGWVSSPRTSSRQSASMGANRKRLPTRSGDMAPTGVTIISILRPRNAFPYHGFHPPADQSKQ